MIEFRRLADGSWSKPPTLTAARHLVLDGLTATASLRPLGKLASFVNGTSYDKGQLAPGGMPIIRISNLSDPAAPFLETAETFRDKFYVETGDLLVSWSASFKALLWPGPPGVLNQHIFRVREEPGVDRGYLRHAIEGSFDEMMENAVGMGMKHLRRADFLAHEVPLPDEPIQQAVAAYLDAVEAGEPRPPLPAVLAQVDNAVDRVLEAIEHSDRVVAEVDRARNELGSLRASVLEDAVRGRLTRQDPADEPAVDLLRRIAHEKRQRYEAGEIRKPKKLAPVAEDEQPFEVPEGWAWTRVGQLAQVQGGYAFKSEWYTEHGIPLLRNVNIGHGEVDWRQRVCLPDAMRDDYERFELSLGDIVLSLDRPLITTGLKVARVSEDDLPSLLLQRVARFQFYSEHVEPTYVYWWLNSPAFTGEIDPGRSNGVPHISQKEVAGLPFPLPPVSEQRRIVARVDALLALCDRLAARLAGAQADAERLMQAVLHDALATPPSVTA